MLLLFGRAAQGPRGTRTNRRQTQPHNTNKPNSTQTKNKTKQVAAGGHGAALRRELKLLVREAHARGIEVILDVVFNHTAEGNEAGPTLSMRGLDNRVYYTLAPGGEYYNYSGCGNTLNCNHPVVRDFIVDTLRYWVTVRRA